MAITISIQPNLQQMADLPAKVEVYGSTVGQCLDLLRERYPRINQESTPGGKPLLDHVMIFVNGKNAYPNESTKPVQDGDVIFLAFLVDGG